MGDKDVTTRDLAAGSDDGTPADADERRRTAIGSRFFLPIRHSST